MSIIGSGNAGASTAFFIAEKGIEEVLLFDIREPLAASSSGTLACPAASRSSSSSFRAAHRFYGFG